VAGPAQDQCLSLDEICTYGRIVTALGRTIMIQAELDGAYAGVEAGAVEVPSL
jgi:hypothetical protein